MEKRDNLSNVRRYWTLSDLVEAHRVGDFERALHELQQEEQETHAR